MKNKVLIIFKYPRGNWNPAIISKFSNYYDTEYLYISDYKDKNFTELITDINNLIILKNITITVFDVDYFKFINFFFIEKINSKKKILITGDDHELHEMNSITASACDLVLSHCPLSVLKYKEKGYESHIIHFEKGIVNKKSYDKKEFDVLFFGALTPSRSDFLNYLVEQGISLKNVGHREGISGLKEEELLKFISKSKIVLNLSKSRTTSVKNFSSENIYKFYYIFKGRIIMAGINGAACVSEYSPGQELLFTNEEVPTFFTREECIIILKKLLNDDALLKKITDKFTSKVCELHEDKKNFETIYTTIEKNNHRRVKLIRIPYWYLRISAKNIILRNIKLSNLLKTITQFQQLFMLLKNTKLTVKFLIISESILNVFWYSVMLTFKPKK